MSALKLSRTLGNIFKVSSFFFAIFSIFSVQLVSITDHINVNFSANHFNELSVTVSENRRDGSSAQQQENSPFHKVHIHGNFHVHDFLVQSPTQIKTPAQFLKLNSQWAAHWIHYDYLKMLLRPPLISSLT